MKKLTRNPILVVAAFWAVFVLLMRSGSSSADLMVRAAIWAAILSMSVVVIAQMIRHRRFGPSGQDAGMPDRIRRWVLDEPDEPNRTRTS